MNRLDIEQCKAAYGQMPVAFCVIEVILDDAGMPADWVYRYANRSTEEVRNIPRERLLDYYFLQDVAPELAERDVLLRQYYRAAYLQEHTEFHQYVENTDRYIKTICYPWEEQGYCACILVDETAEVKAIQQSARDAQINKGLMQKLSQERKQYRDAVLANALFTYSFDLTEGMVQNQVITKDGEHLTEKLGIHLPMDFTEMSAFINRVTGVRYAESYMAAYWTNEGLREAYARGICNAESDYYVAVRDKYFHANALLYQAEDSGHLRAMIICRDTTEYEKERRQYQKKEAELRRIQDTLMKDFVSLYYVNLENDHYRTLKINQNTNARSVIENQSGYSKIVGMYIDQFVLPEYKEKMQRYLSREYLLEYLKKHEDFSVRYQSVPNADGEEYFEVYVGTVLREADATYVVISFRSVDEVAHQELEYQRYLQNAREDAEKANRAKSLFLSNMSHDIRTPMNAVINMIGFMREDLENRERLEADLDRMENSSRFMLSLINDILDMAKIESGEMNLHPEVTSHTEFLNGLQNTIGVLCQEKSITFEIHRSKGNRPLWMDSMRFYQLFFNLLSNAVKNTPEGGRITYEEVCLERNEEMCKYDFYVTDTGRGMSKEFQKKMFLPFEREHMNESGGTGLGLSIVREIVDLFKGRIFVDSEPGKGTKIRVHLELPYATEQQISEASALWAAKENGAVSNSLDGLRILVVEDNALNREIIERLLEDRGVIFESVENGQEAVEQYQKQGNGYYDAILMDIQMPVMNGLEATKKIRSLEQADATDIPIIAMTANAFQEDRDAARDAGMNAHLSKPVNIDQIQKVICSEIKKRKNNFQK